MKKIKLYIASTLDGYIARPDGDLGWLSEFFNPTETDYGFKNFLDTVDTVIMGGRAYRDILNMDIVCPYKDKQIYVVSNHNTKSGDNAHFITEDIITTVSNIKNTDSQKDIWLIGGGQLISMLLSHDLIDEMQIFYVPMLFGVGISLFPPTYNQSFWHLAENKAFENGMIKLVYRIKQQ